MCTNASFTQYSVYKVQNPFSEKKPFYQLLCDIDPPQLRILQVQLRVILQNP